MKIPPSYTITNHCLTLLSAIEVNKALLSSVELPEKVLNNLRHRSLLKSSVFSAQIEGNSLAPEDYLAAETATEEQQYERQEIENIITALSLLREKGIPETIDTRFLLSLHKLVMQKLVHPSLAGAFRTEPSAIFDTSGNVVYMPPPPSEIQGLLIDLMHLINDTSDIFPLVKAALVHLSFEKIHPFIDGNGRVGRLLMQAILAKSDYHFNWLVSIEEVLQERRQTYYAALDQSDATDFIEFMLEIIREESERLKKQLTTLQAPDEEDFLLPRRKEILDIIKDQTAISFDQIHRRFLKVPARTLRYDIQQLEKGGLIRKIGTTRGALYQVAKNKLF